MTVFVVHELFKKSLRDNIEPARKFGDLQYVNKFYIHGDELVQDFGFTADGQEWTIPPGYHANIRLAVMCFDPSTDYLLIAGDHLQILAMTAMLAARYESFMVLRYDRKISDYIPVRLHSGLHRSTPHANLSTTTHIGDTNEDGKQGLNRSTKETLEQYRARTGSAKGFYGF